MSGLNLLSFFAVFPTTLNTRRRGLLKEAIKYENIREER